MIDTKSSEQLIDELAVILAVSGDESTEARWNDELFKRRVLNGAINQIKEQLQIQSSKDVFVVWTNTDRTEGRGTEVPIAVCEKKATAIRLSTGQGVMGSDARIEKSVAVRIKNQWMACVRIHAPTREDDIVQQNEDKAKILAEAREAAIAKAKELGMTDEDLKILAGAK